jgi:hypothetical protein
MIRGQDIVRTSYGASFVLIPRKSGVVRAYPYESVPRLRKGIPFSRPLSEENQDRLEAVRDSYWEKINLQMDGTKLINNAVSCLRSLDFE